jgi:hypothetical protein
MSGRDLGSGVDNWAHESNLSATEQRKTEMYVLVRDERGPKHLLEDCARLLSFQNENGSWCFDLPSSFCFSSAALLPSGDRVAGPEHDDFRADWRAVVEIDDVLVRQADAA